MCLIMIAITILVYDYFNCDLSYKSLSKSQKTPLKMIIFFLASKKKNGGNINISVCVTYCCSSKSL